MNKLEKRREKKRKIKVLASFTQHLRPLIGQQLSLFENQTCDVRVFVV